MAARRSNAAELWFWKILAHIEQQPDQEVQDEKELSELLNMSEMQVAAGVKYGVEIGVFEEFLANIPLPVDFFPVEIEPTDA